MLVVLRRILLALAALAVAGTAQAQSILNWTTHADYFIAPAISATVGSSVIRNPIYIDDDLHPPSIFQTVVDATNASMNFYAPGASTAENHAPYPVTTQAHVALMGRVTTLCTTPNCSPRARSSRKLRLPDGAVSFQAA